MSKRKADGPIPIPTWQSPDYIAQCERQAKRVKIRYSDSEAWHETLFVHTWRRGDREIQRGPIMSASSGPKDYLVNDIIKLFDDPAVDGVSMLLSAAKKMFLVIRKGARLEDMTGRPVTLFWERSEHGRRDDESADASRRELSSESVE